MEEYRLHWTYWIWRRPSQHNYAVCLLNNENDFNSWYPPHMTLM